MKLRTIAILAAVGLLMATAAMAADGAALYKGKCQMCHGADGSGQTPAAKTMKMRDLRADEVQKQTDVELTKVIAGGKGKMPAYGKKMTTDEIAAVIGHVRTLKK